jgi:hypothetical protein
MRATALYLHLQPLNGNAFAVTPADLRATDFAETPRRHKAELLAWLEARGAAALGGA